jgi:hypothetical protein
VSVVTKFRRSVSGCNPNPIEDSGFRHPVKRTMQHKNNKNAIVTLKRCFIYCRKCFY